MRNYGIVRELKPTVEQTAALQSHVGAARFAQNWALAYVKDHLESGEFASWSYFSLRREFNLVKAEIAPWHEEVAERALRSGIKRAADSLANWKKNKKHFGFPRFRNRGDRDSARYDTCKVAGDGLAVRIPAIGYVELKESLSINDDMRATGMVVKEKAGRWFVTVLIQEDDWEAPEKKTGRNIVGVDLGVGNRLATTSDGEIILNPRSFRAGEARLKKLQRRLAKKQKGSKNRAKARLKVARQHMNVANQRKDFIHKFTTSLVENQDVIVIEDLNVKGMKSALKLGKSVSDAGMAEIRRQLEYKCHWYGTTLVVADRWFASSKICSVCKVKNVDLTLGDREWECSGCGAFHDRDLNASVNLMDYGREFLGDSLWSDSCFATMKQEEMSVVKVHIS